MDIELLTRPTIVLTAVLLLTANAFAAVQTTGGASSVNDDCEPPVVGSPYIPVDSWIYPAAMRLYSMGYIDTIFLGMRPWTRGSLRHALEDTSDLLEDNQDSRDVREAQELYGALSKELSLDEEDKTCKPPKASVHAESIYSVVRAISGTPLRDSYHLGSTIINDYGRPYTGGFNNYSGLSGYAAAGRFLLYVRSEFQGATAATGYSADLAQALSTVDGTSYLNSATGEPFAQTTIPVGPIGAAAQVRFLEAYVSTQYLNHVFSFGKQDEWLGPAVGGAMAYSNNAENIYSFRINRIEPLNVPYLSRLLGPFRYDFLVGPLRGHTYMPATATNQYVTPGDPWVHAEKISFRPTENLEIGFERTVIWGGHGHEPITVLTFLRSFFSFQNVLNQQKVSSSDPGARFGSFDFSYRLPFVRNWLTIYADSEAHDDVSPADAPRRAAYRPGIYLSHVPGLRKVDIRAEAVSTDPSSSTWYAKEYGQFMYWEEIQRQGYTNQGQIFGDWIGREDKGGQAWITYHLSGNEFIQGAYRYQKAAKYFIPGSTTQTFSSPICTSASCLIPGGTTLNDVNMQVVKRIGKDKDFEIKGNFAYERWNAPIYLPGNQTVTTTSIQLTWFPGRKVNF
jgi:hypothetical protein